MANQRAVSLGLRLGRRVSSLGVFALLALGSATGCQRGAAEAERAPSPAGELDGAAAEGKEAPAADGEPAATDAKPVTEPSSAPSPVPYAQRFALLSVPNFHPAVLRLPVRAAQGGARILFAAHGAGGSGSEICEYFDPVVSDEVLLVCPTGKPLRTAEPLGGAYYPDHLKLREELHAIFEALRAAAAQPSGELPGLAPGKAVYLGYSQGATMGALAIVGEMSAFSHLVLIEGGAENWNVSRAQSFRQTAGKGVFLVCGTRGCGARLSGAKAALLRAELSAEVLMVEGGGHAYWGIVGEQTAEVLSTFLPQGFMKEGA